MHVNYPKEFPTACFQRLRQLYAEGNLLCPRHIAEVHAHWWNCYGWLAGQLLPYEQRDESLTPIGSVKIVPPPACLVAMRDLVAEADAITHCCEASQGMIAEAVQQLLAETVRLGMPVLLNLVRRYLDRLGL